MRTKLNLENDVRRRLREWGERKRKREREREKESEKVIEMKK